MSTSMFKDVENAVLARFFPRGDEWCAIVPTGTPVVPDSYRAVQRKDGLTSFVRLLYLVERLPEGDVWTIGREREAVGWSDRSKRRHCEDCDWSNEDFQYTYGFDF